MSSIITLENLIEIKNVKFDETINFCFSLNIKSNAKNINKTKSNIINKKYYIMIHKNNNIVFDDINKKKYENFVKMLKSLNIKNENSVSVYKIIKILQYISLDTLFVESLNLKNLDYEKFLSEIKICTNIEEIKNIYNLHLKLDLKINTEYNTNIINDIFKIDVIENCNFDFINIVKIYLSKGNNMTFNALICKKSNSNVDKIKKISQLLILNINSIIHTNKISYSKKKIFLSASMTKQITEITNVQTK